MLLTTYLVVTAAHCVRQLSLGDQVALTVGGEPTQATLVDRAIEHDLALLELDRPLRPIKAALAERGDAWYGPVRRNLADPELGGTVSSRLEYQCQGGGRLLAVQLITQVDLGQYEGYSGGPVYRLPEDAPEVIGVLFEQFPDATGMRQTNTLFAACISESFRLFHRLSAAWLVGELIGRRQPRIHQPAATGSAPADQGQSLFDSIVDAFASGDVDADARVLLRARIGKGAIQPSQEGL